jgi:hypothetical protein
VVIFLYIRSENQQATKAMMAEMERSNAERAARPKLPKPTKEEGAAALAKMRVQEDKVEGFKRYIAKATPEDPRRETGIYLSFAITADKGTVGAGMLVAYAGDDWIFFNALVGNCDGVKHKFDFAPDPSATDLANPTIADLDHLTDLATITRDTHVGSNGKVYEWADVRIAKRKYFEFLHACAKAKESTIRLQGKFTHDHKMSPKEKRAILDTFAAFQAKGGSFNLP